MTTIESAELDHPQIPTESIGAIGPAGFYSAFIQVRGYPCTI